MVEHDWQLTRITPTVRANGPDGAERLPATGGSPALAVGGVMVGQSAVALARPT